MKRTMGRLPSKVFWGTFFVAILVWLVLTSIWIVDQMDIQDWFTTQFESEQEERSGEGREVLRSLPLLTEDPCSPSLVDGIYVMRYRKDGTHPFFGEGSEGDPANETRCVMWRMFASHSEDLNAVDVGFFNINEKKALQALRVSGEIPMYVSVSPNSVPPARWVDGNLCLSKLESREWKHFMGVCYALSMEHLGRGAEIRLQPEKWQEDGFDPIFYSDVIEEISRKVEGKKLKIQRILHSPAT